MNSVIALSAILAVATAAPAQYVSTYAVPPFHHPLAYSAPVAYGAPAAVAYSAPYAPVAYSASFAPAAYSAPVYSGPIAYASPAVHIQAPAGPTVYRTGTKVESTYEPVEQHGYQIAY